MHPIGPAAAGRGVLVRAGQRPQISGDRILASLRKIVLAAFVALAVASIGNVVINQRIFWVYVAFAAILSRLDNYPNLSLPREPEPTDPTPVAPT